MTLWSGRVSEGMAPEVWSYLLAEDAELLPYDLEGTRLHARRLRAAGLLDEAELEEAERILQTISPADRLPDDEDVHSMIERLLGDVGRKIHAGRSRNDQVAAALRLYVEAACLEADGALRGLARDVLARAEDEAETPMPGYTHLQRAQPVTVGHHLLAWVEMLERDLERFSDAGGRAAASPLGSGALAGSTLELPPPDRQLRNSLDAVSDRDFALDYLYACAVFHSHASRIGEELCLWSTAEFGFVQLPESAATGSSMMPQKLNPDVAELARAKAGTALGRLTGLLAVVKGLPLSYNRDLQEDKAPVFAARRDVTATAEALAALVRELTFEHARLEEAAADPLLRATDAAEQLVAEGMPFRDAHEQVADDVREGTFVPHRPVPGRRSRPGPRPCGTPSLPQSDACSASTVPTMGDGPLLHRVRERIRPLVPQTTAGAANRAVFSVVGLALRGDAVRCPVLRPLVPAVQSLSDGVLPGLRLVRAPAPAVPLSRQEPRSRRRRRAPGRPGAIDQGPLQAAGPEVAGRRRRSRAPAGRRDDGRQEPRAPRRGLRLRALLARARHRRGARQAVAELYRVTRPGGTVLIQAPWRSVKGMPDVYAKRLERAGFQVTPQLLEEQTDEGSRRHYGLHSDEAMFICTR